MGRNEIRPSFIPFTKVNSKWIKDLKIRIEFIKNTEKRLAKLYRKFKTK